MIDNDECVRTGTFPVWLAVDGVALKVEKHGAHI